MRADRNDKCPDSHVLVIVGYMKHRKRGILLSLRGASLSGIALTG